MRDLACVPPPQPSPASGGGSAPPERLHRQTKHFNHAGIGNTGLAEAKDAGKITWMSLP